MTAETTPFNVSSRLLVVVLIMMLMSLTVQPDPAAAEDRPTFVVGAIPDQNISQLNRRFSLFVDYLQKATGLNVDYTSSNSYAALVTAFRRGEVHLGWFGGLTGVQARSAVPGSRAIAQRPRDREFHSKFICRADLPIQELSDLKGYSFTFGSESSTSGHLMPRYFLMQAGVDPENDFDPAPNYSGSHDKTWKLVESGAYHAGALNEAVWQRAVSEGQVDTDRVRVFHTTPPYYDYNWTIHADVNQIFGEGTMAKVQRALLDMGEQQKEILELFAARGFIESRNENYDAIREVAQKVGIIR